MQAAPLRLPRVWSKGPSASSGRWRQGVRSNVSKKGRRFARSLSRPPCSLPHSHSAPPACATRRACCSRRGAWRSPQRHRRRLWPSRPATSPCRAAARWMCVHRCSTLAPMALRWCSRAIARRSGRGCRWVAKPRSSWGASSTSPSQRSTTSKPTVYVRARTAFEWQISPRCSAWQSSCAFRRTLGASPSATRTAAILPR